MQLERAKTSPGWEIDPQTDDLVGERGRNRTYNLLIKSQLLCQLSYAPSGVFGVANSSLRNQ